MNCWKLLNWNIIKSRAYCKAESLSLRLSMISMYTPSGKLSWNKKTWNMIFSTDYDTNQDTYDFYIKG